MQRHRHDPSKNLVGFVVGDVEYAVAIARVREITNPLGLVALPHAPPSVVGVADYRGEVVPVVDLRIRFGLAAAAVTRKTKWIVVDTGGAGTRRDDWPGSSREPDPEVKGAATPRGRLVALVVDAVTDVFGTGDSELRAAPALGGGNEARGIAGVTSHAGGSLVFVLDTSLLRDLAAIVAAGNDGPELARLSLPARTAT